MKAIIKKESRGRGGWNLHLFVPTGSIAEAAKAVEDLAWCKPGAEVNLTPTAPEDIGEDDEVEGEGGPRASFGGLRSTGGGLSAYASRELDRAQAKMLVAEGECSICGQGLKINEMRREAPGVEGWWHVACEATKAAPVAGNVAPQQSQAASPAPADTVAAAEPSPKRGRPPFAWKSHTPNRVSGVCGWWVLDSGETKYCAIRPTHKHSRHAWLNPVPVMPVAAQEVGDV